MADEIVSQVVTKVYGIGLKARMLLEWVKIHRPSRDEYSSRQMFTMELIQGFPPITRKDLGIIFGMSASSVSDMVRQLVADDLVTDEKVSSSGDAREKPLVLTDKGADYLDTVKQQSAIRYRYLFDGVKPDEWMALLGVLDKVDAAAKRQVDEMIFGK
ncbi:MAG: winged helix-turn-helix transcriptional regulator [Planctomycetes bacterium]|nr:winged helix-turn-helix transcriptional regulator [Planctomycetota bacterium]